jgi:iron complex transport system substrate-binding protein
MTKTFGGGIELPTALLPEIDDATRREFLIGTAGLLLLPAACGRERDGEKTPGETRTVEDGVGRSVEVPVSPQRVIVLDPGPALFHLVDLGLVPKGATTDISTVGGDFPELLGDARKDIEPVGDSSSPNLERIAALEPDLIFHQTEFSDPGIERLSEIAPTVQYNRGSFSPDPAELMRFVARVVSREEKGEELIGRWEARLEEAAQELDVEGETCSIVLLYAFEPSFNLFGPESVTGYVAQRLGWEIVPDVVEGEPLDDYSETLSLEVIGEYMEADTVLLLTYASGLTGGENESGENVAMVTQSEVWRAIPAVREGRVIEVDTMEFDYGYGFAGLYRTLDTIVREHTS